MKVDQQKVDRSSWDEISIDGWFKAMIPPNWEVDDTEGEVIIFNPDGFGELSVNFMEKSIDGSKKDAAQEIISEWAEQLEQSMPYEVSIDKRNKDVLVMSAEFIAEEPEGEIEFWRIFGIVGKKKALDASYSCPVEDRDREESLLDGIVDSIQLEEPPMIGNGNDENADSEKHEV